MVVFDWFDVGDDEVVVCVWCYCVYVEVWDFVVLVMDKGCFVFCGYV